MKYVFDALTYQKYVLVRLQRVGAGLSFVSHQKSVFLRVCLNKLLSAILQKKHVLVCVVVCRRIALFPAILHRKKVSC